MAARSLDALKAFIADLARPFAIYATAGSAAWATVIIAGKVQDGNDGAWVLGAIGVTLSAIYAGKVIENYRLAASNAEVEKIRAQASPPPAEALKPAPPESDAASGELPDSEKLPR